MIQVRKRQNAPWLLVDIPETKPWSVFGLYYVLEGQRRQLRKEDKVVGVTEKSDIWNEYAQGLLEKAGKIRVFCDPDFVDFVEANVTWEDGTDMVMEALDAVNAGEDENTPEDDG
jgi:hypothetical protein